jgi:hypothetical protein
MRLVVEVEDFHAAVAFFRDALGLPEEAAFSELPAGRPGRSPHHALRGTRPIAPAAGGAAPDEVVVEVEQLLRTPELEGASESWPPS